MNYLTDISALNLGVSELELKRFKNMPSCTTIGRVGIETQIPYR